MTPGKACRAFCVGSFGFRGLQQGEEGAWGCAWKEAYSISMVPCLGWPKVPLLQCFRHRLT